MVLDEKNKNPVKLVIAGHVDHGKSTLVGRLLHDSNLLPDGKIKSIQEMSERRGMPLEYAFLLDSLQAERDQGITIDFTQIPFKSSKRAYVIIDAPGHKEFIKDISFNKSGRPIYRGKLSGFSAVYKLRKNK